MLSVTVWLLIALAGGHSSPATLAQFPSEAECDKVRLSLERKSAGRRGVNYIYGFCEQAVVYK